MLYAERRGSNSDTLTLAAESEPRSVCSHTVRRVRAIYIGLGDVAEKWFRMRFWHQRRRMGQRREMASTLLPKDFCQCSRRFLCVAC